MVRSLFQFRRLNLRVMEWMSTKLKSIYKYLVGREQSNKPKNPKKLPIPARKMYMDHAKHRIISKKGVSSAKKANKKFRRYLDSKLDRDMIEELSCPICLELIAFPTSTPCGHTYCYKCLQQNLILHTTCAVCRTPLRQVTQLAVCEIMLNIINQYMNKLFSKLKNVLSGESLQSYNTRYADNKEYIRKRTVDPMKLNVGDQIDVRDTEYIWCKAIVKQIIEEKKNGIQTFQVLVHYQGWNRVYDEIIDVRSKRLAQYLTFTERTELPHYNLPQGNQGHLRGVVIQGPAPRQELQIEERRPEQEDRRRNLNSPRQGNIFDFLYMEHRDFDEEQQNNDGDNNPASFMDFIRRRRLNQVQHEQHNQRQEVNLQRRFQIQIDPYIIDEQSEHDLIHPREIRDSQSEISVSQPNQDIAVPNRQLNRWEVEELINNSYQLEEINLEPEISSIRIGLPEVENGVPLIMIESDENSDHIPQRQDLLQQSYEAEQGDQGLLENLKESSINPRHHSRMQDQ